MGFKGKGVKVKGVKVKGVKVKGETVLFEFTKKYQKVPGTFAMVPDPRTRDVRLRLRPHNSILHMCGRLTAPAN